MTDIEAIEAEHQAAVFTSDPPQDGCTSCGTRYGWPCDTEVMRRARNAARADAKRLAEALEHACTLTLGLRIADDPFVIEALRQHDEAKAISAKEGTP